MGQDKRNFLFYADQATLFSALPDDGLRGKLLTAVCAYAFEGTEPSFLDVPLEHRLTLEAFFKVIRQQLDADQAHYVEKCESNRALGRKGGKLSAAGRKPAKCGREGEPSHSVDEAKPVLEPAADSQGRKRKSETFKAPDVEEVRAYCAQRGGKISAEAFVDHYTANGWMAGKVRMKDWKAAVRNWERNGLNAPRPDKPDIPEERVINW